MAHTYGGDPGASARDWIRFKLGDTSETRASLSDTELTYLIGEATPEGMEAGQVDADPVVKVRAAVAAAEEMATRYSGFSVSNKSVGNVSLSHENAATADRFRELADRLRLLLPPDSVEETAGGFTGQLMAPARPSMFLIGMGDNFGP